MNLNTNFEENDDNDSGDSEKDDNHDHGLPEVGKNSGIFCKCGLELKSLVVKKEESDNLGRSFVSCRKCETFHWTSPPNPTDYCPKCHNFSGIAGFSHNYERDYVKCTACGFFWSELGIQECSRCGCVDGRYRIKTWA